MNPLVPYGALCAIPNTVRTKSGAALFYRDWGAGEPVLFVAGWSLTSDSWSVQMMALLEAGYRVIAFDRRGHGRSSDPGRGYDFDTLADDIAAVIDALDLDGVTLVGHSMACGEIVRFLSRHGSARVRGAALLGPMTPCLAQAPGNPEGIPGELFAAVRRQLMRDFAGWIDENMEPFVPGTSESTRAWLRTMAMGASLHALCACNRALAQEDFRPELARVDVPVLLIAGGRDASAPPGLTAHPTARLLPDATLKLYEDAPHGMFLTHRDRVNADLLEFIRSIGHNRADQ
ncbi:alpha/beta fold hydrolase [Massilia sp. ST3]|uniref:alpha/beta fold hydrolase n=1 Tax=Massilia sp. ST3 TaxID=2824903 RepID=UPI001B83F2A0|nr:alpha/beta hydrolase [Massilia sp. ST3]MBQ5949373.1 alpha/beta hydrolase [Massilia sp. ST3]